MLVGCGDRWFAWFVWYVSVGILSLTHFWWDLIEFEGESGSLRGHGLIDYGYLVPVTSPAAACWTSASWTGIKILWEWYRDMMIAEYQ